MKLAPNTTNQVRFQDVEGDQVWFDVMDDEDVSLIVSTKTSQSDYAAASLTREEVAMLVKHLRPGYVRELIASLKADLVLHWCAECGSTDATTYVVTQLDPNDPDTRTEVCRACDDMLREQAPRDAADAKYAAHIASKEA